MTQQPRAAQAETEVTPYQLLGGAAGVRRLVDRFYDLMDSDPSVAEVRRMHAPHLGLMRDKLSDYLSGWLGGPPVYMLRPDAACVMTAHRAFRIGAAERDQWMACMRRALAESPLPDAMRALVERGLGRMCDAMRNA